MMRRYEKIDWNSDDPDLIDEELGRRCDERCGLHLDMHDLTPRAQERIQFAVMAEMEREHRVRWENNVVDSAVMA